MAKLLVVHLSDIHVRTAGDVILTRGEMIAAAVRNLEYDLNACVVAVSGDLAYGGNDEQLFAGWDFLDRLASLLATHLASREGTPVPVTVIAIPGNHDCDFSNPARLRSLVIPQVLADPEEARNAEVVTCCTEVQEAFFNALSDYSLVGHGNALGGFDQRLAYGYDISVGSKVARFLCFNTAWLSQLHERQGDLYFPADAVPHNRGGDVVVAMFHHPYNWIESNAARAFRKNVETVADLILSGHEHDAMMRNQQVSTGQRNTYIEGGALQDSYSPHDSTFNAFVLDLDTRRQKMARFVWDGDRYTVFGAVEGEDAFGLAWEAFQVEQLHTRGAFHLASSMEEHLNDPGINLLHQRRGAPRLSEIFVLPDLETTAAVSDGRSRTVRGDRVADLLLNTSRLLIVSDAQAGKTSLAKIAFRLLYDAGNVPVMLDGSRRLPIGERLHAYLVDRFIEQYQASTADTYRQLDRARRAVIIDDFHRLPMNAASKKAMIETLTAFAGKVLFFANDLILEATDLLDSPGRTDRAADFATYRIQPLGHLGRHLLVEKWLLLAEDADARGVEFLHRRETITGTLNGLIGRNWLPSYPIYILAILQASEGATPVDTRVSTFGGYYELFIRAALAHEQEPVEFSITLNYLAHLAYTLFRKGSTTVDIEEFAQIHREFEARYEIPRQMDRLISDLVKRNIITRRGDSIRFKYKYVNYYFVASWMRDNIGDEEVRTAIAELSRTLHVEENANILLFLAHLSRDPMVVAEMLAAARSFYPNIEPATFTDDVAFLSGLRTEASRIVYEERDIEASRRRLLSEMDEHDAETNGHVSEIASPEDGSNEIIEPIATITAAIKTLRILGQILKNFPGSLEGDTKLSIARECYSLGLRMMASLLNVLRENQRELLVELIEYQKNRDPQLRNDQAEDRASEMIVSMIELIGLLVIRAIASSVGSPNLGQTYARVLDEVSTPAYRLVNASIRLDHTTVFPAVALKDLAMALRNRSYSRTILSHLVVEYFHLFPVSVSIKQEICNVLGINYSPSLGTDTRRRLIAPRASS